MAYLVPAFCVNHELYHLPSIKNSSDSARSFLKSAVCRKNLKISAFSSSSLLLWQGVASGVYGDDTAMVLEAVLKYAREMGYN